MLESYLKNPELEPPERKHQLVLSRLLEFLLDKDNHMILRSLDKSVHQECDLAIRLVEHLFSKLSASTAYTLDMHYPSKITMCECGCKTSVAERFGDTSIGNNTVWHGCLDIILGNLPVAVVEKDPVTPGRKAPIDEVKVIPDLEHPEVTSQLIAQAIVYSFAQKKKHPEFRKFLCPTIGVNRTKVIFYFYDCEHDILLKSRVFPIFDTKGRLNYETVIAVWLVVNYIYLCSGCSKDILSEAKRTDFFHQAGELLHVYQKELSVGGVDSCIVDVAPFIPGNVRSPKVKCFTDILAEESEEGCAPIGTL